MVEKFLKPHLTAQFEKLKDIKLIKGWHGKP